MSAVYATESNPVQYLCRICGRNLTNAAITLDCSFEAIKNVHETAHRLGALRTLREVCQELQHVFPWDKNMQLKKALQTLDDLT